MTIRLAETITAERLFTVGAPPVLTMGPYETSLQQPAKSRLSGPQVDETLIAQSSTALHQLHSSRHKACRATIMIERVQ
jgi:hypothetical protein